MNFSVTGFTGSGFLQYKPATSGPNVGVFQGQTRAKTAPTSGHYGLLYTATPPPTNYSGIDVIDFDSAIKYTGNYFYGFKNVATPYFSGNFTGNSVYLYETCHGVRQPNKRFLNYYPAYYRYGYFEAPWGRNPTRTAFYAKFNPPPEDSPDEPETYTLIAPDINDAQNFANGFSITTDEYHQLNGIVSLNCGNKPPERCDPREAAFGHFHFFYYDCPRDIQAKNPSYQEAEVKWLAGNGEVYNTGRGPFYLVGASLYNNSPIPTIFDINGNLFLSSECSGESNVNVYDSMQCPAAVVERQVSSLRGSNSLLTDYVANVVAGLGQLGLNGNGVNGVDGYGAGGQDVGNEDFWFWHFIYKENAADFPFGIGNYSKTIAQEDWYWKHRLCPDYPKFLPWTFGGNIFAAPETYFEVPYYSAIGKFGFYGMRFLNSLGSLVDNENNGNFLTGCSSSGDPFTQANPGIYSYTMYDNLLNNAVLQRKYSDFYAGNKGLFLALNYDFLTNDPAYTGLSSYTSTGLKNLHDKFWIECGYSKIGYPYLLQAWIYDEPTLMQDSLGFISINPTGIVYDTSGNINHTGYYRTGVPDEYLYTNYLYEQQFSKSINLPITDINFIDKYSKYIVRNTGASWNTGTYNFMYNVQKYLFEKRAIGHEVNGLPVDLYPMNRIYYSYDDSSSYKVWANTSFNRASPPSIPRAYFQGYYGISSGNIPILNFNTFSGKTDVPYGFNPGFYNDVRYNKLNPKRNFFSLPSGQSITNIVNGRQFLYSGLSLLGYNEIGKLDGNFSCFSPIFVQQPVDVICKVGQTPIFRCLAVDYHTIPEDKLKNGRWPEINYWAQKLKLLDNKKNVLYPLSYSWGRFPLTEHNNYNLGQLSGVQWANKTGDWCGLEKTGSPTFTLIHPKECQPVLTGQSLAWEIGTSKNFASFVKGAKLGIDDQYYYFCAVSGRFGIRRSEPARLIIDNTLQLDIAFKNGSSKVTSPQLALYSYDANNHFTPIVLKPKAKTTPYYGFAPDPNAIPETALAERRTANPLGCLPSWNPCCKDNKKRGMGIVAYGSWNYTWQPPNIQDLPLLNSNWGQMVPYGGLVTFSTTLTQNLGDALYGRNHLPQAISGNFIPGFVGVPFDLFIDGATKVKHWSVEESAWATDYPKEGVPFENGGIPSALYPPSEGAERYAAYPFRTADQTYGKGYWQFSNNLGLIKRLGYLDVVNKDASWDGNDKNGQPLLRFSNVIQDKNKLISNIANTLKSYPGGLNGGWRKSSLGRHMAYYIEGVSEAFHVFCGNKKKEFVKNLSYIAPGLRVGNAGFQYAWIGQPNSSYLSRQTMPGPYAYFWRVNRHNRDKNGNGMPLGMYAYSVNDSYSMMYDLPAIYGLYLKNYNLIDKNKAEIQKIKDIRIAAAGGQANYIKNGALVWTQKFEFNSNDNEDDGTTHWCGSPFGGGAASCSGFDPVNGTDARYCLYPNYTLDVAGRPDLSIYECPTTAINANLCFPPCLSVRYDQGIVPGGKNLNLFGKGIQSGPLAIVADASQNGSNGNLGPAYTPWAQALKTFLPSDLSAKLTNYQSIDPNCGGGSDHCNYVTPTVWLGSTQKAYSNMNYMANLIKNLSY
jgi:hypothetical protein